MAGKVKGNVAIAAGILGIIEVLFGLGMAVSCFIMSGVGHSGLAPYYAAFPLLVSGSIAIGVWPTKNKCLLIATLVINIILQILLGISAAITGIASALWSLYVTYLSEATTCMDIGDNCRCDHHVINDVKCEQLETINSVLKCFVAFSILGLVVGMALSIVACVGVCCQKPTPEAVQVQGGQVVIMASGPQQHQQQHVPPPYQTKENAPSY